MSDLIRILRAIDKGDPQAADQLLPLVYDELRRLAIARVAGEKAGQMRLASRGPGENVRKRETLFAQSAHGEQILLGR
jgi:hypothetical protein